MLIPSKFPLKDYAKGIPIIPNEKVFSLEELSNFGQQIVVEVNKERIKFNHSMRQKKINQFVLENNPIPLRYQLASLHKKPGDDNQNGQNEIASRYVTEFPNLIKTTGAGLFLWGKVGSGKTHLACAVGNALLHNGFTALYSTVAEILATISASKSFSNNENEADALRKYLTPDVLIIDEVGLKKPTENELNVISSVIQLRERNLRPIIAISNHPPHQLRLIMNEMIVSRITGHGSCVIKFDRDDRRIDHNDDNPSVSICFDESDLLWDRMELSDK